MADRINFIDGYRGVAILLVILFHGYSRWPEVYPYAGLYSEFILFKYGKMGVQLFFLISGFVILMSLEKTSNFGTFLFKRWIRLFPAMLICSVFIYATSSFFTDRPQGQPNVLSLLPGLFFIEPQWFECFFKAKIVPLEGSFWSLYVEVKFYVFSAAVYYIRKNSKDVIWSLIMVYVGAVGVLFASSHVEAPFLEELSVVVKTFSFQRFGLFAAGASLYYSTRSGSVFWFCSGLIVSIISFMVLGLGKHHDMEYVLVGVFISVVFFTTFKVRILQKVITNRCLVFLGYISYPLYLIHDNILVSSIAQIGRVLTISAQYIIPIIPFCFLVMISYGIAVKLESEVRRYISALCFSLFPHHAGLTPK